MFFDGKIKNVEDIVYESMNTESITGLIYKRIFKCSLQNFMILMNISDKVEGKAGSGTIFIYSNLVKLVLKFFKKFYYKMDI